MKINILRPGIVKYDEALQLQHELLLKRQQNEISDTLLLLQHPPVITLGTRGKYANIKASEEFLKSSGISVYETNRGGDVTYHGPGQLVGYPIIDLAGHGKDIKSFVWKLQEVFIRLLYDNYGIEASRDEGTYTGVWVDNNKITAIGIAVKRWVTMHGFAFNISTNIEHFSWITPCGITDRGVTSMERLLGRQLDFSRITNLVEEYFINIFGYEGKA